MGCSQSQPEEPKYVAKLPEEARVLIMRYILNHPVVKDEKHTLFKFIERLIVTGYFIDKADAFNHHWEKYVGDELDAVYAHPEYTQLGDPVCDLGSANPEFVAAVAKLYEATRNFVMHTVAFLQSEGF